MRFQKFFSFNFHVNLTRYIWLSQVYRKGNQVAERKWDLWRSYREDQFRAYLLGCSRSLLSSKLCQGSTQTHGGPVRDALVTSVYPSCRNCLFRKIYIINEVLRKDISNSMDSAVWFLPIRCGFYNYNPFFQQLFHWVAVVSKQTQSLASLVARGSHNMPWALRLTSVSISESYLWFIIRPFVHVK